MGVLTSDHGDLPAPSARPVNLGQARSPGRYHPGALAPTPGSPDGPLPADRRRPHPARLDPAAPGYAAIMTAHDAAVGAGEPLYQDPATGLSVMTAAYLWRRGYCCDQGCRHCPYVER